jgi:hypothetical protein
MAEGEHEFTLRFIPGDNPAKFIHMDREWDIDELIEHLMNWVINERGVA